MPKLEEQQQTPGRHARRARSMRVSTSLAEINVVPLVDVMLVLLIIFMVAAPMLQRGVEVNLPVASRSQEIASDRIFVNVPLSFREDRRVYIGQDPVRVDVLTERMRQMMVNRTDRQVFLRGDGGVELQELLDIMDRLKAAGVEKVGIVSKLPGEE
jgi:biopolymer transport protein ExbD